MTSFRFPAIRLTLLLLCIHLSTSVDLERVGGPDKFVFAGAVIAAVLIVVSFAPRRKEFF